MNKTLSSITRRHLLVGSAGALATFGLASWTRGASAQTALAANPLPPYVEWKNASSVIVHSKETLETRRSAFGTSVITPTDQLYIRARPRRGHRRLP